MLFYLYYTEDIVIRFIKALEHHYLAYCIALHIYHDVLESPTLPTMPPPEIAKEITMLYNSVTARDNLASCLGSCVLIEVGFV